MINRRISGDFQHCWISPCCGGPSGARNKVHEDAKFIAAVYKPKETIEPCSQERESGDIILSSWHMHRLNLA